MASALGWLARKSPRIAESHAASRSSTNSPTGSSRTMRCASSRSWATSTTASGATSCNALKIDESNASSGSRTRMRSSRLVVRAEDFFTGKKARRRKKCPTANALPLTIYASRQMKSIFSLSQLALANDRIAPGQLASAAFAAFIYRDRLHEINAARHLPTTQPRPTMREQFSLGQALRYHTGRNFFIPTLRFATENNRRSHSIAAQDFSFHFRWMHFFAGNVDQV